MDADAVVRCLVVDDDVALRQYLETLLHGLGIQTTSARDGQEAEYYLRTSQFELVFLDLRLPAISGELLLAMFENGRLKRPNAIVLMSTSEFLGNIPEASWAQQRITGTIEKPFGAGTVKNAVERALGRAVGVQPLAPRFVVLGGGDLWANALTRVLERMGGVVKCAPTGAATIEAIRQSRPLVAIVGPPIPDYEVLEIASALKTDPTLSGTTLLVAMDHVDGLQCRCLLDKGVASVILIPAGMSELSTEIARRAGFPRREHLRVPLASEVVIQASNGTHVGQAIDISEGGLGVKGLPQTIPSERFDVSFTLTGSTSPIHAGAEAAWISPSANSWRMGLRFQRLDEADERLIQQFVERNK